MIPWMLKIAIIEYWKEESIAVCCNALFYGVLIHVGWTRRGGLSGELFGDLLKCFGKYGVFPWYG